jgi:hypothetical protein
MQKTQTPFYQLYKQGHKYFQDGKFDLVIQFHTRMLLLEDCLIKNEYTCRIFWELAQAFEYYQEDSCALFFYELALEYWVNFSIDVK